LVSQTLNQPLEQDQEKEKKPTLHFTNFCTIFLKAVSFSKKNFVIFVKGITSEDSFLISANFGFIFSQLSFVDFSTMASKMVLIFCCLVYGCHF
jgi:hypothetical protein